MADTVNCPNCGSTLAPGATACARCGHQLAGRAPDPMADAPPPVPEATRMPAAPTPTDGPSFTKAATASMPINIDVAAMLKRWGLERTPIVLSTLAAAVAAILIASLAHTLRLLADDFQEGTDAVGIQRVGFGIAIGFVALTTLVRWQTPAVRRAASQDDTRIAYALGGMAVLWMLVGLFLGFDERLQAEDSWFFYALVFGLVTTGFCILARPLPESFGTTPAQTIGLGAICVAAALLVIGMFMGMSDSISTYSLGVTLQDASVIVMVMAFALFSGLPPRDA